MSATHTRAQHPEEQPVEDKQLAAVHSLFSRARSGRYFGGLWYKVFSERGPC
jgi:hypothetical protein